MLAGGVIGVAISAVTSIAVQYGSEGSVSWGSVAAGSGFVSGAMAASNECYLGERSSAVVGREYEWNDSILLVSFLDFLFFMGKRNTKMDK